MKDDNFTTISFSGIELTPPPPLRPEDAIIPAAIPELAHCPYLLDCTFVSGVFRSSGDGRIFTDDEVAELYRARYQADGYGLFLPLPLTHMAYDQVLRDKAQALRDSQYVGVEVERADARIVFHRASGRGVVAVRLFWLHTGGPPGASWGSNNWTPERGKRSAETMREFERLNEGRL